MPGSASSTVSFGLVWGTPGGIREIPRTIAWGDHAETLQIDYDPGKISYAELLEVFGESHDPTRKSYSRQYMSAVFYHSEAQKKTAMEMKQREASAEGEEIYTEIVPAGEFYSAEAYHQKYMLRRDRLLVQEYSAIYPELEDFVDSTAVARVNGYVAGNGTPQRLKSELAGLGLSPEAGGRLVRMVER